MSLHMSLVTWEGAGTGADPLGRHVAGLEEGTRGLNLLGAPVGDQEFKKLVLNKRLDNTKFFLDALPSH